MEYENHCISLILQLIENYIKFFGFCPPLPPRHNKVNPPPWQNTRS